MARQKFSESIKIPEGIICTFESNILKCKKGDLQLERKLDISFVSLKISAEAIEISSDSANKKDIRNIKTLFAHIRNIFSGLNEKFIYNLGVASVHFPMSLKIEGKTLVINNFLGEKVSRKAKILPNADVEIKGEEITITSFDKEAAGQTAANFEKATRINNRDRRIFQDGIYITSKPAIKRTGVKDA